MIKCDENYKNQSEIANLDGNIKIIAFMWNNKSHVRVEIEIDDMVDGYSYHDYPSSVDKLWDKDDVKSIISKLNEVLEYMDKLDEVNNG